MEGEKKVRETFFWVLRLLVETAIVITGIYFMSNYAPHPACISEVVNATEIGLALTTIGLSALWLEMLKFLYERKGERAFSRRLNISMFLLMTLFLIIILLSPFILFVDSRYILLGIAIAIIVFLTGSVILFGKPLQLAQAFREHKIISLAAMLLLLLLLASAATYGYVHQYNVNVRYSMRGCKDNLRTIDSAIMQYSAANNGKDPESMDDLMGTYIRVGSLYERYGHYYYIDTSGSFPRAACSKGHTY